MNESKADQTQCKDFTHVYFYIPPYFAGKAPSSRSNLIGKPSAFQNIDNIEKYLFFFLDLSLS